MFELPERYPDPEFDIECDNKFWDKLEHHENDDYENWKCKEGEPS